MDDFLCGHVTYRAEQKSYIISCGLDGVVGSAVTIKGKAGQFLALCEVEVMNDPTVSGKFF